MGPSWYLTYAIVDTGHLELGLDRECQYHIGWKGHLTDAVRPHAWSHPTPGDGNGRRHVF